MNCPVCGAELELRAAAGRPDTPEDRRTAQSDAVYDALLREARPAPPPIPRDGWE